MEPRVAGVGYPPNLRSGDDTGELWRGPYARPTPFTELGDMKSTSTLQNLWHYYQRSARHRPEYTQCETVECERISWECQNHKTEWIPLSSDERPHDMKASTIRQCCYSTLSSSTPSELLVRGRVLNYVAYLPEYTCDLASFFDVPVEYALSSIGRRIHAQRIPESGLPEFGQYFRHIPENFVPFDAARHSRRIAILGVAGTGQVALVPATTRKGDVIVAAGVDLLPLVFSPSRPDASLSMGLFKDPDPYDKIPAFRFPLYSRSMGCMVCGAVLAIAGLAVFFASLITSKGSADVTHIILMVLGMGTCIFSSVLLALWIEYLERGIFRARRRQRKRIFDVLNKVTSMDNRYEFQGPCFVSLTQEFRDTYVKEDDREEKTWSLPLQEFWLY